MISKEHRESLVMREEETLVTKTEFPVTSKLVRISNQYGRNIANENMS